MAYEDLKDLNRRAFAGKVLRNKAFSIVKDPKYDGYQCGLASMDYYKFFDKKILVVILKMKVLLIKNKLQVYTNQLLESLIKNKYSKCNKGFWFWLCVIDIYKKYFWVLPLKDKKRYYNY